MDEIQNLLCRASEQLEIPQEILTSLPILELKGNRELSVERHNGISGYSDHFLCINVSFGILEVEGCGLNLRLMNRDRLVIAGEITSICFRKRGS